VLLSPDRDKRRVPRSTYDLSRAEADFPEWTGAPRRTLVICTQQRSGSTLLGEAIYFAGGLGCPIEYFHAGFRSHFERRWRTQDLRSYANTVHRYRTDPGGVFSVKLFWENAVTLVRELEPAAFAALAHPSAPLLDRSVHRRIFSTISEFLPNPTFVFLTRQHEIRQAISASVASQTCKWRRFSTYGRPRQAKYDFNEIVGRLAEIQSDNRHWLDFFAANAVEYNSVSYEDLADNYDVTLRRLFDAIGRPDAPITPPRLQKQADANSEALLEKFLIEFRQRTRDG
jgi:LPS sulfotransferase NodH